MDDVKRVYDLLRSQPQTRFSNRTISRRLHLDRTRLVGMLEALVFAGFIRCEVDGRFRFYYYCKKVKQKKSS